MFSCLFFDPTFFAAVVGAEEDEGVFINTGGLELLNEFTHLLIDAIDHGGIDLHDGDLLLAFFVVEAVPVFVGGWG